jgi:glycerophosphoryl diester phosphodiesterase
MKLPLTVPKGFRIIGHRGASGYAPENTLAAFRLAERIGTREIELDVRFSKDRQIVICHDRTLDRYGYPDLQVAELTLDELLALDMGSWFSPYLYGGERVLTVEALFALFRERFVYHVEIKDPAPGLVQALLHTITAQRLEKRVIFTSKHYEVLTEARALAPFLRVGWIVKEGGLTVENIEQGAAAEFFQICPRADETEKKIVAAAHARLPEVRAHSVKGVAEVGKAIEAGCDGLTINWPDWLIHEDEA